MPLRAAYLALFYITMKNILGVISEFSKKLSKFEESENSVRVSNVSDETKLKNEILLSEEERKTFILSEYKNYSEPVTKEIEDDEECLLKAYDFFKQIEEIKGKSAEANIKIMDSRLFCPLCTNSDYTQTKNFIFLQIWFVHHNKDKSFVPVISSVAEKKYCIDFIKIEDWKLNSSEKEILQIIEKNY